MTDTATVSMHENRVTAAAMLWWMAHTPYWSIRQHMGEPFVGLTEPHEKMLARAVADYLEAIGVPK